MIRRLLLLLDVFLLIYFLFIFPYEGVIPVGIALAFGWISAGLIAFRFVRPYFPDPERTVFVLKDCRRPLSALQRRPSP